MEPTSPTTNQPSYPKCPKGNQARSVCLSEECNIYPFYCAVCEQQVCQLKHLHGQKIASTGFRELMKKVREYQVIRPQLAEICRLYRESLEKLRRDITKFVERQLVEIQEFLKRSVEFPQSQKTVVRKLLDKQYESLKGLEMDKVWACVKVDSSQRTNKFENQVTYIKNKTIEINEISADFEKAVSLIQASTIPEVEKQEKNPPKKQTKSSAEVRKPAT